LAPPPEAPAMSGSCRPNGPATGLPGTAGPGRGSPVRRTAFRRPHESAWPGRRGRPAGSGRTFRRGGSPPHWRRRGWRRPVRARPRRRTRPDADDAAAPPRPTGRTAAGSADRPTGRRPEWSGSGSIFTPHGIEAIALIVEGRALIEPGQTRVAVGGEGGIGRQLGLELGL